MVMVWILVIDVQSQLFKLVSPTELARWIQTFPEFLGEPHLKVQY